jgi:transcription-repair coupling factor (superfamily II helicase)
MEAYRRMAVARDALQLAKVRTDMESAYGAAPAGAQVLLDVAELRLAATILGVRSIVRREQDVVFRTTDPTSLEDRLRGAQGTVRVVGQSDELGLTDVYYRPPKAFLEPKSLLLVLRKRLAG